MREIIDEGREEGLAWITIFSPSKMTRLWIFARNTFVVFGAQLLLMLLLSFVMRRRMDYYLNSGAEVPGYERFLMAVTFFWRRLWPFIVIIFFWIGFGTAGAIELFGSRKERA